MHAVWYPEQRRDKAIFDVCMDLLGLLEAPGIEVTRIPAYQLLQDFVEVAVRRDFAGRELPQGFQFTITRYTGYDHEQDPDVIIASPFVPLNVDRGRSWPSAGADRGHRGVEIALEDGAERRQGSERLTADGRR